MNFEEITFITIEPTLWIADVERSVEFYTQELGAAIRGGHEQGMTGRFVTLGIRKVRSPLIYQPPAIEFYVRLREGPIVPQEMRIWVSDLDGLFAKWQLAGKPFVEPFKGFPHGYSRFVITDPDGHRLTFCSSF